MEISEMAERVDLLSSDYDEMTRKKEKEYEAFLVKYHNLLDHYESTSIEKLIKSEQATVLNQAAQVVSCIGCRTSIERFYKHLIKYTTGSKKKNNDTTTSCALDPFVIDMHGDLTINESFWHDPFQVYTFFYLKWYTQRSSSTATKTSLKKVT